MKFKKTVVCSSVQFALVQQADMAERVAELNRQAKMNKAIMAGLSETDKRFGGGLVSGLLAGLNRLRGRA
ncbi:MULTISPECIES: hypothetical protein [Aeromonas]|uniref:hypothetical protein n=1 Tax=Aeromonas TaxID=642 RepID=UPI00080AA97F|nr:MULTISPECIES: hypothetical protein [Aeromonas]ANT70206.1 hypothetical protein TK34_22280 [Aeromonas hydrophila]MDH0348136.1 hypothetical protein [Aeromonas dhakensis]